MKDSLRIKLREALLDRFGLDINEAEFHYSTQNWAFVFEKSMIRVGMKAGKSRQEIISELMWVDDLKQFKQTICEPDRSQKGKLLEEIDIDGQIYSASIFRTARGSLKAASEMKPMFFICAGDLLGGIHQVSTDERELGMHYKRRSMHEVYEGLKQRAFGKLPKALQEKAAAIGNAVDALPQGIGKYGLCHGDFHAANFFVEANNIWLFDFDSCFYADYLYDVAALVFSCLTGGLKPGKDRRQVMDEDIMPYLKIGYELNKPCEPSYWDDLELLLEYRIAVCMLAVFGGITLGTEEEAEQSRQFLGYVVAQEDMLAGMTQVMAMAGKK